MKNLLTSLVFLWSFRGVLACPEVCSCTPNTKGTYANCHNARLGYFPTNFPNDTYYIDLGSNAIKTVNVKICSLYPELEFLSLSYNQITYLQDDVFADCRNLKTLLLYSNALSSLNSFMFRNSTNLVKLDLGSNSITTIPPDTFLEVPNLEILYLNNNKLGNNIFYLISSLTLLTQLDLGYNAIGNIETGVLTNLTMLIDLVLDNNEITDIHMNAFVNLGSIESLYLRSNKIIAVSESIFQSMNSLRSLDLSQNSLSSLPENLFDKLNNLYWLSLNHNNLSSIPKHFLVNKTNLYHLHLYNNIITDIHVDAFVNLNNLRYLRLENNMLTTVDPIIFQNMDNLYELSLHHNNLSSIPKHFLVNKTNLYNLYLYNNIITDIHADAFVNLNNLLYLDLYNNIITDIHVDAFVNLNNLLYLRLQSNMLTTVDPIIFKNMDNLNYLNLQNNKIKEIKSGMPTLMNLNKMYLFGNLLLCDCGILSFYEWATTAPSIVADARCTSGKVLIYMTQKDFRQCSFFNCECFNGGSCVTNEDNSTTCKCVGDWSGEKCQVSQCTSYDCGDDVCYTEPENGTAICRDSLCRECECYNGGFCVTAEDNSIKCQCVGNWTGDKCQVSQCASYDCGEDFCYTEYHNGTALCKSSVVKDCECYNGGSCVTMEDNIIKCQCVGNWTGERCQVSQCTSYDCGDDVCYTEAKNGTAYCKNSLCRECECYNGGSCVTAEDNSITCQCVGNWTGDKCQVSQCTSYDCGDDVCYTESQNGTAICKSSFVKDCECYNGGYCVTEKDNTMKCQCVGNWTGEKCQVSQCASYDCRDDDCYTEAQNGTAICKSSFVKDCECYNGGSCVTMGDKTMKCQCVGNWTGERCQVSECASYDCGYDVCYTEAYTGTALCRSSGVKDCECYNGGSCVTMEDNTIKCECVGNWTGERCQVSQCAAYDCGNAVCYTEAQNGTAICKSSFVKDCECYNGGSCVTMGDNTVKCQCVGNWTGEKCQISQCGSYDCGDDVCFSESHNGTAICKSSLKDCECYNGGFCVTMDDKTIKCQCVENWTGEKCQVSQCASYDCGDDVCYTEAQNGTAYCRNSLCQVTRLSRSKKAPMFQLHHHISAH